MNRSKSAVIILCILSALSFSSRAELLDQGLNSIMQIIDKAIIDFSAEGTDGDDDETAAALTTATATIVNLSKTLGSLSYSRLQCGEADVLSEFTQRVQQMPEDSRDAMRNAFQAGFDKSKNETTLLSEDECKRLTESRIRTETVSDTNVVDEDKPRATRQEVIEEEEALPEEPKLRHLRIAELSGQLAYKRKICDGDKVFNRDYNVFLNSVPEEYLEEVKKIYWKGYNHGKRLNPNLTSESC